MSGLAFTITRDAISPALALLGGDALSRHILQGALSIIVADAQRAFDEPSLRPSTWLPRKARKGDNGHPLMILSGDLRKGLFSQLTGSDSGVFGSPQIYAATQQLGSAKPTGRGGGIPPRPFFPVLADHLTDAVTSKIDAAVKLLIDEASKG